MKKYAFKRLMAALLAVTLIIGAIPIGAFAESERREQVTTFVQSLCEEAPTVNIACVGDTLIAGTGVPGNKITVRVPGDKDYDTSVDESGHWSVELEKPLVQLESGKHILVIASCGKDYDPNDPEDPNPPEPNPEPQPNSPNSIPATVEDNCPNSFSITAPSVGHSEITGTGAPGASAYVRLIGGNGKSYKFTVDENGKWAASLDEPIGADIEMVVVSPICEVDPEPQPNRPRSIPSDVLDGCDGGFTVDSPYEGDRVITGKGVPERSAQVRLVGENEKSYKVTVDENGDWRVALDEPIGENVTKIVVSVICTQDTGTQTDPDPKCYSQDDIDKLQKEIDDLKDKLAKCGANSEKLQEALDKANKELADAKKLIEKKDKYIENLEKRVRELGKLAADLGKLRSKLEAKLHAAQDAIDELKAEGEAKDAKIAELEKQLADAKAAIEKLEKVLADNKCETPEGIEKLKKEIENLTDKLKKTEDALATSEESRKKTEGELTKTKKEKEISDKEIEKLKKELAEAKKSKDALMKEFQALSSKYKEANAKGKESLKPLVSDAYKSLIPKTTKSERDNLVRSSFAGGDNRASTPTIVAIPKAGIGR